MSADVALSVNEQEKATVLNQRKRARGCRVWAVLGLILLSCILCIVLVLGAGWATGRLQSIMCDGSTSSSPIAKWLDCTTKQQFNVTQSDNNTDLGGAAINAANIYERAKDAVVGIGLKDEETGQDQVIGTGFIISPDGLIATNQHVVSYQNAEYFVKISDEDTTIEVQQIYRDNANDLAILKINRDNLITLPLGNSDTLKPGQEVIAIGNPLGDLYSTVTSGIISGLNREVALGTGGFLRSQLSRYEDTIQTDAAINPGNSGGPLLNAAGEVIGINFATVQGYDNLSFAVPVNYLKKRVDELNQFGKFRISYLGIQFRARLATLNNEAYVGAQVLSVDSKSSAAGVLKAGDIIVEFDGKDLEENNLANLIQRSAIGSKVAITLIRGGKLETVEVTIGERA